jgi:hypothetical protein
MSELRRRALVLLLAASLAGAPGLERTVSAQAGPSEGIQVHGHWVIEVRERNGTLVTRRAFENALVPVAGQQLIGETLGGWLTIGAWTVYLTTASGTPPCPGGCSITEPNVPAGSGATSFNLAKGSQDGPFKLVGNVTALSDGVIDRVATSAMRCARTTSPQDCSQRLSLSRRLTEATLASPIAVVAGQQVLVTVAISFTSGP